VTTTWNWTLVDIFRTADYVRCEKCNAKLRWVFLLAQGDSMMCAGSECVRALTYICDPTAAVQALNGHWRTRRRYVWRKIRGITWSVGQRKDGRWWVGYSPTVGVQKQFLLGSFATVSDAKAAAALHALVGVQS
jgi:hypothetical protein